jgi:hypothetical protein
MNLKAIVLFAECDVIYETANGIKMEAKHRLVFLQARNPIGKSRYPNPVFTSSKGLSNMQRL